MRGFRSRKIGLSEERYFLLRKDDWRLCSRVQYRSRVRDVVIKGREVTLSGKPIFQKEIDQGPNKNKLWYMNLEI